MTIDFPAPEEAKPYSAYVALFKVRNPGIDFKDACKLREGNHKQFYDWSWQQPEAQQIYEAYKQH